MRRPGRLRDKLDSEIDDALATAPLVAGDEALSDRVFNQLVDLLVERAFAAMRASYLDGDIEVDRYRTEVRALDHACRRAGLLGPRA